MVRIFLAFILLNAVSVQAQDYKRAPNSYVYDVDYAALNHYGGLNIPVKKAYEVWSDSQGLLNAAIPSGQQSAFVYWEDVPGLIRNVEISGSGQNAQIKVGVNSGKGKGNAVISFHVGPNGNQDDPIYWTWHVWVTDDPTNGHEYSKGFETNLIHQRFDPVHMDRNLGAVNAHFLGNDWNKSAGLFYQWGRKDPFPPLLHKDRTYYELNGLVGNMTNQDVPASDGNHYKLTPRPSDEVGTNIKYAVQHPIEFLIETSTGTWFSSNKLKSTNPNIAWDLWGDNYRGGLSNANSSNPELAADSKSYELKSVYDPCPSGWRVVSNYGREAVNNNLSPYGRSGGGNDDIYNAYANGQFVLDPNVNGGKPSSTFLHTAANPSLPDLKIYPKLGFDFRTTNRNLGLMPVGGKFVLYKNNNGEISSMIYQDELSDGGLWSATYGSSNPRFVYWISDSDQPDNGIGRYRFLINQVEHTTAALNVRCIKDPNVEQIGHFPTQYFSAPEYIQYTKGLHNPNSYLIEDTQQILEIPVNKAFSVYNQILTEGDMLMDDDLKANVYWTTNSNLIKNIKIVPMGDPKDSKIRIEFNTNETGNAVVSLHNRNIQSPAYWSWHIWVPNTQVGSLEYITEEIIPADYHIVNATKSKFPPLTTQFMDRNLGALDSFPSVNDANSPNQQEIEQIANSGGFHYQWGRKDPIPSFKKVGNNQTYDLYKGISVNGEGVVSYQVLNADDYESYYTEHFNHYVSQVGIENGDDKFTKADKIIRYSVENPLTFLYHQGVGSTYTSPTSIDYANMRDWVSASVGAEGDRSLKADRWGHATSKSPFDPCPEGWRVPDMSVVLLRTSGKGTSPWYFSRIDSGKGVDQRDFFQVNDTYKGKQVKNGSTQLGWAFNHADFKIGNFPKTGTIGELGNATWSDNTGVWTAAMSDYMVGYGMAMQFNSSNGMRTATGVYPQAGLNVRCAKDQARYVADETVLSNEEIFLSEDESLVVYPNPVHDYLNLVSDREFEFALFDLNGKLIQEGKTKNKQIDFSFVNKGVYLLVLNKEYVKKIIKN